MLATIVASLVLQGYREAYPLPDKTVPSGLGVNTHFVRPGGDDLDKIEQIGFKWIRTDFEWNQVEKRKGRYDFGDYDALVDALDKHHLRAMFILDHDNPIYQRGGPTKPESKEAFARFCAASAKHFHGRGIVWELWNEPNLDHFWWPKANADEYAQVALSASRAIRDAAPDEWLIGPATSLFDWGFLEACFKAGLLEYWDGVSVHPYRDSPPETAAKDWNRLRRLVAEYAPNGKAIQLIAGEWGYSDAKTGLDTQATYAARMYIANLASGVPFTIWYDWKNDVGARDQTERHYGIVSSDSSAKPVARLLSKTLKQLNGWTYVGRISSPDAQVFRFRRGSSERIVAWSTTGQSVSLTLAGTAPFEAANQPTIVDVKP